MGGDVSIGKKLQNTVASSFDSVTGNAFDLNKDGKGFGFHSNDAFGALGQDPGSSAEKPQAQNFADAKSTAEAIARAKADALQAKSQGRSATILGGGVTDNSNLKKKKLLGE